MTKKTRHLLIAAAAIALSACSGAPSESDIKAMMEAELEQTSTMLKGIAGNGMADAMRTDIHDVTLHGCDEIRDEVYRCDVEVDVTAPLVGRNVQRSNITLAKTDAGWTATR